MGGGDLDLTSVTGPSFPLLRGDELLQRDVTLAAAAAGEWTLRIDSDADAAAQARRANWLHRANAAA